MLGHRRSGGSRLERIRFEATPQRRAISAIFGGSPLAACRILRPQVSSSQGPRASVAGRQNLQIRDPQSFHLNSVVHDHKLKISPEDPGLARVESLVTLLKNDHAELAKHENLRELITLLEQPAVCSSISEDTLNFLFSVISSAILRDVPDIPQELLYGENFVPIDCPNWSQLSVYHQLAITIVKGVGKERLFRLVDCDCIRKLVDVLNSPDRNEEAAVESLLTCLFEQLPEARNTIYRAMMTVVNQYLDGVRAFVPIPSALRFFTKYFNTMSMHWSSHYNGAFRNVFVKLFGGHMLKEYYPQLAELCSIFYAYDSTAAMFALKFLLRHWPLTNTAKEVIYLHHLATVVTFVKLSSKDPIIDELFLRIRRALVSPNFKLCDAALKLVGDDCFMCYFSVGFAHIIPALCKDVSELADHWNVEVRTKAKEVFQRLYSVSQSIGEGEVQETMPRDTKDMWMAIFQAGRPTIADAVAPLVPHCLVGVTDHRTPLLY